MLSHSGVLYLGRSLSCPSGPSIDVSHHDIPIQVNHTPVVAYITDVGLQSPAKTCPPSTARRLPNMHPHFQDYMSIQEKDMQVPKARGAVRRQMGQSARYRALGSHRSVKIHVR